MNFSAGPAVAIRETTDADLPDIRAIYSHHVLHGLGSFEEVPPDLAEMRRRRGDVLARGLPYIVAMLDGRVAGYAYAGPYRTRSAYRYTVEDSIYVSPDFHRQGVGRALLEALIARCTALGFRQMIAVIGDSANDGSIGLHAAQGFVQVALLPAVGFKFGRWVDGVLMQRALGEGQSTPPATR
ncbi:MAG TPA: GNAT family N-acetyltransferase [Alphaproteobacteria bacterium]|nr:GNAT family N-acetyltransferase [Alphaproteobacteria bacterium]